MFSLITIVRNEQDRLPGLLLNALELPGLADIVIVDQNSTDGTLEIVSQGAWKGSPTLVLARDKAHGFCEASIPLAVRLAGQEWILHLDADERLNLEMVAELIRLTTDTRAQGFYLGRRNFVDGKEQFHPTNKLDPQCRLFRKSGIAGYPCKLHRHLDLKPPYGTILEPFIIHAKSKAEALADAARYKALQAGITPA